MNPTDSEPMTDADQSGSDDPSTNEPSTDDRSSEDPSAEDRVVTPEPHQPGSRRNVVIGGLVVLALVAAIAGFVLLRSDSGLSDGAVLSVDGTEVTTAEFDRRIEVLSALYGIEVPPPGTEEAEAFRRDSAKSVALSLVLDRAAAERGVDVAERTAADALARYIEDQYPIGGRDAFVQALGDSGVNEAEVLDELRRQLLTSRLFDDVVGTIEVDDAAVEAAYEERQDELRVPETRRLRHLVVSTEDAADAARARIDRGEAFADVAAEVSLDGATAESGGDLGFLRADQLDPAFGDPAFAGEVGDVFGPVQTDLGWYVGTIEAVEPPNTPALDEIRDALRQRLETEAGLERWRTFLTDAIAEADIVYDDDHRPDDPLAPPPVALDDPLDSTGVPVDDPSDEDELDG